MKTEIEEQILATKLKKLNQSNQFQDLVEKGFADVVAEAKEMLRGESSAAETQEALLRMLYLRMSEGYRSKKTFFIPKVRTAKSRAAWGRVEKARVASGQDSETYLQAQFVYFHTAFGRPPTIAQLGTAKAIERAREFVGTKRRVMGPPEYKMAPSDLLRASDQRMRALCKAQDMTRREVYERLVKTKLVAFPKEYTQIDPTYREVMEQ